VRRRAGGGEERGLVEGGKGADERGRGGEGMEGEGRKVLRRGRGGKGGG